MASRRARVVVTGGAGFIGSHSVRRLAAAGATVLVIDDLSHACGAALPPGVDLVRANVGSRAAAQAIRRFRPDALLHLAAQVSVNRSVLDPVADVATNVLGTVAIAQAAQAAGCRRLVFASSGGAVYGTARRLPSRERDRTRALSPYGAAKLAAEAYLDVFRATFGISTVALRYANVYGPDQDGGGEGGVVARTAQRLLAGLPARMAGDGGQTRDFVFVADVAEANRLALEASVTGPVNIGTGLATPVRTLLEHLARLAGSVQPLEHAPLPKGEVRHSQLSVDRAERRLGWVPATRLADGLAITLDAVRAQLQGAAAQPA